MIAARAALLAVSLVVAAPSAAQAPAPAAPPQPPAAPAPAQASLGVASPPGAPEGSVTRFGIGAGIGTRGTAPTVYLPLDAGPVRMELDGSYAKVGTKQVSSTTARVGLGLFALVPIDRAIRCPAGVRLEYARDDVPGATAEAIRFAAAIGGEWAPVPAVALGVETQVGYSAGLGDRVSGVDVSAQAILRVFLSAVRSSRSAGAAAAPQDGRPRRLTKCQRNSDCERPDICFDGYCRH
jgi:hypothetical protein